MKLRILTKKRNLFSLSLIALVLSVILISQPNQTTANEMNIENQPTNQINDQIHLIVSRTQDLKRIQMTSVSR